ncbi:hypothetical protein MKW92_040456, partial [Papaver armeniacum]
IIKVLVNSLLINSHVFSLIFSKPVQISHDGEERFLKDMQFGSIDWSTLRPPSSLHETEEDSLSTTSTIDYDYYYTDEEYPTETEDDEDDERPT